MHPVRVLRTLGTRRHPLCRGVDIAHAWLTVTLAVLLLVGGPLVAFGAGRSVYRHGMGAALQAGREQARVDATLTADATANPPASQYSGVRNQLLAPARWYDTRGVLHAGTIVAVTPARAGTVVEIWINAGGDQVAPPPRRALVIERAIGIGASTAIGFAFLVVVAFLAASRSLDRRRFASWHLAWESVEPRWSGRR
jgi:hypothetical protein